MCVRVGSDPSLITISLSPPERNAEVRFTALKQEGNDYVKKGQYQDALGKYSDCLKLKPEECSIYTNRLEAPPPPPQEQTLCRRTSRRTSRDQSSFLDDDKENKLC